MQNFRILVLACVISHNEVFGSSRIVNGTNAEEGEFPFAVSLRYKSSHTCGGTILNENFVLTAAHCVCTNQTPRNSSLYSIQYGMVNITRDPVNTLDVKQIFCHQFDSEKLIYDCAVLELESSLPNDKSWRSVELSQKFVAEKSTTGVIIGWGKVEQEGPLARTLQKLDVDVYDETTCRNTSRDNTHHICFGSAFGGACNGDSGTALLVDGMQVGIASFITDKCGVADKDHPNVYSKVSSYYEWISKVSA
ncbi:chymotrypsin-2-like [Cylas formicarius]|uniref:chymotrypsin-2-like n=1 Tax=Cylas formicarius TaxID=197179 RepID=UPI0029584887|nr:chymotrypsin-2-like [Cylas formicarius]